MNVLQKKSDKLPDSTLTDTAATPGVHATLEDLRNFLAAILEALK